MPIDREAVKSEAFQYRLDLLKLEVDLLDRSMERGETVSLNVKNFAVVVWAAMLTIFVGRQELHNYVVLTALVPIMFWGLDTWWTRLRIGPHVRKVNLYQFLNSTDLEQAFLNEDLSQVSVLDTLGTQYRESDLYKRWSDPYRIAKFKDLVILYGGMIVLSMILGWLFFVL